MDKGVPGSFLVRPSHSNPGNFTLSVRREDCVTHIRIQNTDDFLDLYGGEKFATLSELVDYYRENHGQLKEKNGSIIELRYPLFSQDPIAESSRWFHGRITGKEAQKLLLEKGKYGSYLVRESVHQPESYVLSVATGEQVSHILIRRKSDGKFDVGGGHQFSTLKELIDFYTQTPMVEKSGGLVCLKQPFNATRLNVSTIDKRIRQLERENGAGKHLAGFLEEFEELHQDLHDTKAKSRSEGAKPYNLDKNRYKNILPFDPTHVRLLDGDPNVPGSDYINANFIKWPDSLTESLLGGHPSSDVSYSTSHTSNPGTPAFEKRRPQSPNSRGPQRSDTASPTSDVFFGAKPRYIATQGTLPNTVVDFWRMIWQERSAIIVMITKEVERGRNKCWRYWPSAAEKVLLLPSYGGTLRVRHDNEFNTDTYTLRQLFLTRDPPSLRKSKSSPPPPQPPSETDTAAANSADPSASASTTTEGFAVYHYQFHAWPDHGTPSDPSCVLNFMFEISDRQETLPDSGPIVVHCSAGIGRTGTFIVIDMLINYIKRMGLQCDIDISRAVQAVREQRSGMVQTETQYRFIYKAVQSYVSTLSQRLLLRNELQPFGVDYTNINPPPELGPPNASGAVTAPATTRSAYHNGILSSACMSPEMATHYANSATVTRELQRLSPASLSGGSTVSRDCEKTYALPCHAGSSSRQY
ncbi:hypothetical protein AAHC03_09474 [Spirometra sp. Aus1]